MNEISMQDFCTLLENDPTLHILDVRPKINYHLGHVPGAVSLPLSSLEKRVRELDKNKHYYVICRSGNTSRQATDFLTQQGYQATNVQEGTFGYPGKLER